MLRTLSTLYLVSFFLVSVFAQTQTVPDPDGSGNQVVEVVTVDVDGDPTTVILSTIPATPTTPAAADPPDQQQGPVAAPPDTATLTGPAPLVYTYTTTDAVGDKEVITATFAPTYQTPNPTTPLTSGTVWGFSAYTKQFGGAVATHGSANSLMQSRPSTWMWTTACGVLALVAGGILFA